MPSKIKKKSEKHIQSNVIYKIGQELREYTISMQDSEKRKAKDKFMDLYQKAEYAYKQLLIDYKINVDGLIPDKNYNDKKGDKRRFNPDRLNIVDTQVKKVMKYAEIALDNRLFCNSEEYKKEGQKSCRILRNEITHKSSKKATDEVFLRKAELYNVLESFLNIFTKSILYELTKLPEGH